MSFPILAGEPKPYVPPEPAPEQKPDVDAELVAAIRNLADVVERWLAR